MTERIKETLQKSIEAKQVVLGRTDLIQAVKDITETCISSLQNGGKILFCGNGGSAADAQHLAAELSGRFYFDREPLFAEALHVNTSYITAVANDYSYDQVYSRLVKAKGSKGDVLIGLSTSGNSKNILLALEEAKKLGMKTVGFTGQTGGEMNKLCDIIFKVPSDDTPRIQECHIWAGHTVCELIEASIFERK